MKTLKLTLVTLGGALGLAVSAAAQSPDSPTNQPAAPPANEVAPPAPASPALPPGPGPSLTNGTSIATNQTSPPTTPGAPSTSELMQFTPPPDHVVADGEKGLRLNFRNAPLEMVLNYLSDAAGFVIIPEVEVKGRVDVWSNQPLTKDEAVDVLNSMLNKNGFAALRNGRTLTIVSKEEAKKRDIPVKSGSDPESIPKNDEIVTQIIPIRYINAPQLIRDLQPLLPMTAQMSANEGGNSLLITDTQVNIRRMAEIVKALDTALSSVSAVKVFSLKYADAKALAAVLKDLFTSQQDQSRSNDPRQRFFNMMRGGGGGPGGGGPGDMGGGGSAGSTGGGRAPAPKVIAVADERSNSLVVSAPDEQMTIIEDLVKQVDTNVEDITELRVFRLKYADAQEMADLLTSLFPDPTGTQSGRGQIQFGGRGGGRFGGMFGGGLQGNAAAANQSTRMQMQSRVTAVPDMRTRSVVVTASKTLMEQIAGMVEELDADPSKKQKVFVYSLENTDPQAVQEILQGLFPAQNTGGAYGGYGSQRNTSRQTGNQLNNRANQNQNQGIGRNSGFGGSSSGFGSGMGGGSFGR
jgi:type II secretory pathway component GspD/PulD (secretin)